MVMFDMEPGLGSRWITGKMMFLAKQSPGVKQQSPGTLHYIFSRRTGTLYYYTLETRFPEGDRHTVEPPISYHPKCQA